MLSQDEDSVAKPGEYTYENSGLTANGSGIALVGAIFVAFMLVGLYLVLFGLPPQERATGPSIFLVASVGALFLGIGTYMLRSGIAMTRSASNESIKITPTEIAWVDRNGIERVRAPFETISHVQETTMSQPNFGQSYRIHHKCTVETAAGTITFNDNIDDYEALKRFCISNQSQHAEKGTFDYRSKGRIIAGFAMASVAIAVLIGAAAFYFSARDTLSSNDQIFMPIITLVWAAGFTSFGMYTFLSGLNERVVIAGGHLTYYNLFGQKKVDVPLEWVEKGSYKMSLFGGSSRGKRYEVQTPQGPVTWSDQMNGCTDLCGVLENAAKG